MTAVDDDDTGGFSRSGTPVEVVLVEDNPGDVRLVTEAFDEARIETSVQVATDGVEALETLSRRAVSPSASPPDLVLLDLNLPRMTGFEVLDAVRADPALSQLPILVLSSSAAREDVLESYDRSANAYLTKPVDPGEFVALADAIGDFWIERATLPAASV